MKYYASWEPGIFESREALKIIKQAGYGGIESAYYPTDMNGSGLEHLVHNPTRDIRSDITNPKFRAPYPELNDRFTGYHLGVFYLHPEENHSGYSYDPSAIVAEATRNIRRLTPGNIGIETLPYVRTDPATLRRLNLPDSFDQAARNAVNPAAVARILETGAKFIFDISHVLCAGYELHGNDLGIEHYFDDMLSATWGNIKELHLNVPEETSWGIVDVHGVFSKGDISKKIMSHALEVIQSPGIEYVTLEIYTHSPTPVQHARIMAYQLDLVKEKLAKRL